MVGLDSIAPEQTVLSYETLDPAIFFTALDFSHLCEPPPMETQLDARSSDDGATIPTACSSLILPSPSLPPLRLETFHPPKWHEIPQRRYKYGKKQWSYTLSEPLLFQVDGSPGINMGDAFRQKFVGLKGRDDLVLQYAKKAISCRFLVRLSC